jgi:hypothetical protein
MVHPSYKYLTAACLCSVGGMIFHNAVLSVVAIFTNIEYSSLLCLLEVVKLKKVYFSVSFHKFKFLQIFNSEFILLNLIMCLASVYAGALCQFPVHAMHLFCFVILLSL